MTEKLIAPQGCLWCGVENREHGQRYHELTGFHAWAPPPTELLGQRLRERLQLQRTLRVQRAELVAGLWAKAASDA